MNETTSTSKNQPSVLAESTWQPSLSADGRQFLVLGVFLIILFVMFSSLHERFFSISNFAALLSVLSVVGIVTLGQLIALVVGGFDLSTGGVVPLAGVIYALLINKGFSFESALLIAVGVGALVGIVNGILVAYAKINPLITTLGTLEITGGLALTLTGGVQIPFEVIEAGIFAQGTFLGMPTETWIFLSLSIVLYILMQFTTFGRRIYAVGDSVDAARFAGIHTNRVTLSAYSLCAALAAVAGVVLASQLLTGSGVSGTGTNLQSLAAAILGGAILGGGRGSVIGALLGVLIIGTLANGMALLLVPAFYQTMTTGFVLLIAVGISQLNIKQTRLRRKRS